MISSVSYSRTTSNALHANSFFAGSQLLLSITTIPRLFTPDLKHTYCSSPLQVFTIMLMVLPTLPPQFCLDITWSMCSLEILKNRLKQLSSGLGVRLVWAEGTVY